MAIATSTTAAKRQTVCREATKQEHKVPCGKPSINHPQWQNTCQTQNLSKDPPSIARPE